MSKPTKDELAAWEAVLAADGLAADPDEVEDFTPPPTDFEEGLATASTFEDDEEVEESTLPDGAEHEGDLNAYSVIDPDD